MSERTYEQLRRAIAMEWFRLRSVRSTWLIIGLSLFSSGGLGLAVALAGRDSVNLALARSVVNPGQPAPTAILLGILGALGWGHDHRFGTLRPVLGVLPRRGVLALARTLVLTGVMAVVAVGSLALGWLAGLLATGGDLAGYLDRPPIPRTILGCLLLGLGSGVFGMAVGALIRSLPAAIAVLFGVPLLVEPLAGMVLAEVHDSAAIWLPFRAIGELTLPTPTPGGPPAGAAAAIFLGVMLLLQATAVGVFLRRDAG